MSPQMPTLLEQRFLSSRWLEICYRLWLLGEGPCSSVGSPSWMPSRSREEHGDRGGRCGSCSVTPSALGQEEEEASGTSLPVLQAAWRGLRELPVPDGDALPVRLPAWTVPTATLLLPTAQALLGVPHRGPLQRSLGTSLEVQLPGPLLRNLGVP